jgi:hypothetical protein
VAPTVRDGARGTDLSVSDVERRSGTGDRGGAVPAAGNAGETGSIGAVAAELRQMLASGELDLPVPATGRTAQRWAALSAWGGRDLSLARLAEGHVDALAILAEAGRTPVPGALYGVWASRSGGASVRLEWRGGARVLDGVLRFCSGARVLDRALVVADTSTGEPGERLLLDVDLTRPGLVPLPGSWCTAAMADADTLDVAFEEVRVDRDADVGEPGWYVARPGFALGGAGVAAVWWGGAAGVLDRALGHLGGTPDRHALAHVGELHAALAAAEALLQRTATIVDARATVGAATEAGRAADREADAAHAPRPDPATEPPETLEPPETAAEGADGTLDIGLAVATLRAAVERAAREVVDRAPRIVGPGPLSRDPGLARALADLALYVRQHHAERDHAALGERVLDRRRT